MENPLFISAIIILGITVLNAEVLHHSFGWCYTQDKESFDGFEMFDARTHACIKCGRVFSIKQKEDMKSLKCCRDGNLKTRCTENEFPCGDGGYFAASELCDGNKNCVNGKDEENCTVNCHMFSCNNEVLKAVPVEQCIDITKVCDGVKDCISGVDESNCTYFGGRCNGFLCAVNPQCIGMAKACDGMKDCLDGTDEMMCQKLKEADAFECKGKDEKMEGFPADDICDDKVDCSDKQDEANCFVWAEWSKWPSCRCSQAKSGSQTLKRTRSCGTLRSSVNPEGRCTGDYIQERNVTCECGPAPTEEPQKRSKAAVFIVIALTVVLLLGGGLIVLNMVMRQKRAWLSYTQAEISFQNHTSDSLISPRVFEASDEQDQTPPGLYTGRRLPATPPGTSGLLRAHSSMQNGSHRRAHSNYEEGYQASILSPREEEVVYGRTVQNPLYHAYNKKPKGNNTGSHPALLSAPNYTVAYESCESEQSETPNGGSEVEYTEVFHEDDIRSNLMEQIEIAQMGNLIEVSDIGIN